MRGCSRTLIVGITLLLAAVTVYAAGVSIPHGSLELISEQQSIVPGHDLDLGLHFQLENGWHIYWVNAGDSGEPTRVDWHLPAGLTAGAIEWPTPKRLESGSIVDYGYEGAVLLIIPFHVAASFATGSQANSSGAKTQSATNEGAEIRADIRGDVKLLICSHEMCVPGKAQLSLSLPASLQNNNQTPASNSATAGLFAEARRLLPGPAPASWKFSVAPTKDSFVLAANVGSKIGKAVFFPENESQVENAAPQQFASEGNRFRLTLKKSDQLVKPIDRLKGVLVVSTDQTNSERSYQIDVPVGKIAAARPVAAHTERQRSKSFDTIISGGTQP